MRGDARGSLIGRGAGCAAQAALVAALGIVMTVSSLVMASCLFDARTGADERRARDDARNGARERVAAWAGAEVRTPRPVAGLAGDVRDGVRVEQVRAVPYGVEVVVSVRVSWDLLVGRDEAVVCFGVRLPDASRTSSWPTSEPEYPPVVQDRPCPPTATEPPP